MAVIKVCTSFTASFRDISYMEIKHGAYFIGYKEALWNNLLHFLGSEKIQLVLTRSVKKDQNQISMCQALLSVSVLFSIFKCGTRPK